MTHSILSRATLVVVASCVATGCSTPPPPAATSVVDVDKIAEMVKTDARQLVQDFNSHDAVKAVSHDAPGIVSMFHGVANVVGPEADLAMTRKQLADPEAHIAVSDETVDVASAGDMAVYHAAYAFIMTDPATKLPVTEHGNWVVGYRLQPTGGWKIAWNVVSDTPAPVRKGVALP